MKQVGEGCGLQVTLESRSSIGPLEGLELLDELEWLAILERLATLGSPHTRIEPICDFRFAISDLRFVNCDCASLKS